MILATQEAEIRRIRAQSQPQANSLRDPILKIPSTHTKKAGGVAQVVRVPASKYEALSSNPSAIKQKKKSVGEDSLASQGSSVLMFLSGGCKYVQGVNRD
jgi:hypothetical protein